MDKEQYITERLDCQIHWYDSKSQTNKKWFKSLRAIEIVCAAIIPFFAGLSENIPFGNMIIGILGIVIAICVGLSTLNKYHENWLNYRTICETLRHEKYLFMTNSKPYAEEGEFGQFVEKIESLISKENSQWSRNTIGKSNNKSN
ncbi:MAG: DUF4231 domain-containing protein [Candidatus Electrothrix sp. AR3]|nr:DUF4231 domain-containing protein [Candidatus Electrothrix sp. AR3]